MIDHIIGKYWLNHLYVVSKFSMGSRSGPLRNFRAKERKNPEKIEESEMRKTSTGISVLLLPASQKMLS